jgi:aromatic-L-amino-acid/L-tryptophan decarboxylase
VTTEDPMRLGRDRGEVLDHAASLVKDAWRSFDEARPIEPPMDDVAREVLAQRLPEEPTPATRALDEVTHVMDRAIAQSRPRYLAYIGSSGLEIGAVGDLIAASYDVNLAVDARAASRLEEQTAAWLADFLGYPANGGWFTSGGTVSNLSGLAAARERALPHSRATGMFGTPAAVYCSAEAHYSVRRAAEVLGLGADSVRGIPVESTTRRMRVDLLREAVEKDLADGVVPVAVVGTGGTTLTGAVDPLDGIADVCEEHSVWFHVDGAYGLPAAATSRRRLFAGLERADSVAVDAHKWLFVPKACSAVLTRHPEAFGAVFSHDEAYMPHEGVTLNAVDLTLEYSRPLRALKLWLAFRVHGAGEFRQALERNLEQAQLTYELAAESPDFQVMDVPPALSVVPVRHLLPGCPDPDGHNSLLAQALQEDGRVYISPADIDGHQWLRPCFTNVRTHNGDVEVFFEVVRELGERMCPGHGTSASLG